MSALEHALKNCLADFHASNVRYRHLGFSSKNLNALDKILETLTELLPTYRVWNGEKPDQNTPPLRISRKQFVEKVFEDSVQGLIIFQPFEWLNRWHILDKQAFFSALSTHHGGYNVIVIFWEGNEFATINHRYFEAKPLASTPITAWISTKTKLS